MNAMFPICEMEGLWIHAESSAYMDLVLDTKMMRRYKRHISTKCYSNMEGEPVLKKHYTKASWTSLCGFCVTV